MSHSHVYVRSAMRTLRLALLLLTTSCSPSVIQQKAVRQFDAHFECPSASVFPAPGGYRVEGCGVVGFYRCRREPKDNREMYESSDPSRSTGDALVENLLTSIVNHASAPARCWLQSEDKDDGAPSQITGRGGNSRHHLADALQASARSAPLTALLTIDHGRIELSFDAKVSSEYVTLRATSERVRLYSPCKPQLFHDGAQLTADAVQLSVPHEVQFVLPRRQVRALRSSQRVDGNVCGLRFSLGSAERETLADFARSLGR